MSGQSSPAAPDPPGSTRAGPAPQRSFPRVVLPLMAIELCATLETVMAIIAIPAFMHEFEADAVSAGWTLSAYLLVGAASAATSGRLGDIFGRRTVLTGVLFVGLLGSVVSLLAPTLWILVLGRGLQGFAAGALPLCFGLIRELLPADKVPLAMSLVVGMVSICAGVGGLIGGILLDVAGWRPIFVAASTVGVAALVLTRMALPHTPGMSPRPQVDVLGGVLLAPACAGLLLGATLAETWGWADSRVLTAFAFGAVATATWVWWERRVPEPMVHLELFQNRKIVLTTLATLAVGAGVMGATSILSPIVLQLPETAPVGLGLAASAAGGIALANSFLGYGASAGAGRIAQLWGARRALLIAGVLQVVSATLWMVVHKDVPGTIFVLCLTGMASAMALTALPTLVVEVVPKENTSEATGMNRLTLNVAVAMGVAFTSMLLSTSTVPGTNLPTVAALNTTLIAVIVISAAGIGLALIIKGDRTPAEAGLEGEPAH